MELWREDPCKGLRVREPVFRRRTGRVSGEPGSPLAAPGVLGRQAGSFSLPEPGLTPRGLLPEGPLQSHSSCLLCRWRFVPQKLERPGPSGPVRGLGLCFVSPKAS